MAAIVAFFDDPGRRALRQKVNRSFVSDYLFKSEIIHYSRLRLLVNGFIGLLLSTCLYQFAWKRLNFADFFPLYDQIVKWFMIIGIATIFTISPIFRCATLCMITGVIGKQGQVPLATYVFENTAEGPISNIIQNFRYTSDAVLCNLQVQTEVTTNRVSLLTGPMEDMIEKAMIRGVETGKKITHTLKSLIDPFKDDFDAGETEEDTNALQDDQAAKALVERGNLQSPSALGNATNDDEEKELMAGMRTELAQKVTHRMLNRCGTIFNRGMEQCHEIFGGLKLKCIMLLRLFGLYICNRLEVMTLCEDAQKKWESNSICARNVEDMEGSNTFDSQMAKMLNATNGIEDELKLNIHVAAIQLPRLEHTLILSDVKTRLKGGVTYAKVLLSSLKEVVQTLLIFLVYFIFRDAVSLIGSYSTNIEFNNKFITSRFWEMDRERAAEGKEHLGSISKAEWREMELLPVFGWPTKAERKKARQPLFKWLITALFVGIVIVVDRFVASILKEAREGRRGRERERTLQLMPLTVSQMVQKGVQKSTMKIVGNGTIAQLLNDIMSQNTTELSPREFTTKQCSFDPVVSTTSYLVQWIVFPLVFMLLLQVFFAFIVKRLTLFYVLPFMFPKRSRVRIIYLYNKILFTRLKNRQQARARIRFIADRWKMNDERNDGGLYSQNSWFKRHLVDRLFKTAECIYCKIRSRPGPLVHCPDCPATYCKQCVEELGGDCYACQAQEGLVNSLQSRLDHIKSVRASDRERRAAAAS